MRKIILLAGMTTWVVSVQAQKVSIPVGKKWTATTASNSNITMSAGGQDIDVTNESINKSDYAVISVSERGYSMTGTVRRLKMTVNSMGNEQTVDSDNEADKGNAAYATVFDFLNKPVTVSIIDNKVSKDADSAQMPPMGMTDVGNDLKKFILAAKDLSVYTPGYSWTDSSSDGNNRIHSTYTVGKSDSDSIEVLVTSSIAIQGVMKQNGMEVKQDLKGVINSRRSYSKQTAMLHTEEITMKAEGITEVMGQEMPISIKSKTNVIID